MQPLHRWPDGGLLDIYFESPCHISLFPPSCHFLSAQLVQFILDHSVFPAASSLGLSSSFLFVWFISASLSPLCGEGRSDLKKKKKKIEYSMLLPWQLHPGAEPVLFHRHACSLSLILPPLAVLRLKLTSDENEEKDRPAGETREKAALVREEWRFITLPGNNVLFSVMTHYYWWWIISKTDIVSELHTVYNKGNTQCFPCTVRCFLVLCRGFGCWVDGSDCG